MIGSGSGDTGSAGKKGRCTVWMLDVDVLWKGPEECGPFLCVTFDDPVAALRAACTLTDEYRLKGIPVGEACVFLAYDDEGNYLGGDTYDLDKPGGKQEC